VTADPWAAAHAVMDPASAVALAAEDEAHWQAVMAADPAGAPSTFDESVSLEVARLKIRDRARERYRAEQTAREGVPPFDAGTLAEILARPPEPAHRAQGIIPSDAGTLIVAQRKTGKTTLELNYARCLISGEPFLGRFDIRPATGMVVILNYEVGAAQLGRWADEARVDHRQLYLVNLRGRRNPLSHPEDRGRLAALLRTLGTEVLIVDPFGRAYSGASQNDPGEVGAWLTDLDLFARAEVGATDVVLAAHAGWDGERTRGSSALEDWADSIITLVRGKGDGADESQRFLHAMGRDVEVEEDQLEFHAASRTLRLCGAGSRKVAASARKIQELVPEVIAVVQAEPGITASALYGAIKARGVTFQKGSEVKAAQNALQIGWIRHEREGKVKRYYPTHSDPSSPNLAPHSSPGGEMPGDPVIPHAPQYPPLPAEDIPHAPSIGGGDLRGVSAEDLTEDLTEDRGTP
jgi:AAA domain-containing protein